MSTRNLIELRELVRAVLGRNDAYIDQLVAEHRRTAVRVGAQHDVADALVAAWHAHEDPAYYAGRRGPKPRDPMMRAMQIAAEREGATSIDVDASTPAAVEAAELLADAIASSWGRGRQRGARAQAERRAIARRDRAVDAGQASFGGFGWGMPA